MKMPRPTKKIDLVLMQRIADEDICKSFTTGTDLYTYIANQYDKQKNSMLFPDHIEPQVVGLRINDDIIKLKYPKPVGRRGKQPGQKLTQEHKEKLISGRKSSRTNTNSSANMEKWKKNMEKDFAGKQTLLGGVLRGNKSACIKAMCVKCMGGYIGRTPEDPAIGVAIRDCRGFSCPLYIDRPFQKKTEE
jgi:hypothetical protein